MTAPSTGVAKHAVDPTSLAESHCLVIGAASGIGQATLKLFKTLAASVTGADLTGHAGALSSGASGLLPVDVADPLSVRTVFEQAIGQNGRVDVVVNTAGVLGKVQPMRDETPEEFERIVRINLLGAFNVSQAVLPHMAANGYGRLIHFSSTAGKEGVANMAAYSASKAGVMGLVKALAKEYAPTGVTVNGVAPGKIDTPLLGDQPPTADDLHRIPMRRLGTAHEAASLVSYIGSPQASYTTGFIYDLSGGRATY